MYQGKLKSITVKKDKAIIEYTDNIKAEGVQHYIPQVIKKTVDHAVSERFENIMRSFLGHGLVHLGLNCSSLTKEAMASRKCVDMNEFKNFNVTSLKFNGDGESSVVVIGLTWTTPEGAVVAINVPPLKTENGGYVFEEVLSHDLDNVEEEAKMYLANKNYLGQQIELFAGEEDQF